MGMYDQSWCAHCGTGMTYTEDEDALCGPCAVIDTREETIILEQKIKSLIEYMKIHLISLEQDADQLDKDMSDIDDLDSDEYKDLEMEDVHNNGKISAVSYLLSVANDILSTNNERE